MVETFPSTEIQLVYSTAPVDWAGWLGKRLIHAFLKGTNEKWNTNNFVQNLNSVCSIHNNNHYTMKIWKAIVYFCLANIVKNNTHKNKTDKKNNLCKISKEQQQARLISHTILIYHPRIFRAIFQSAKNTCVSSIPLITDQFLANPD